MMNDAVDLVDRLFTVDFSPYYHSGSERNLTTTGLLIPPARSTQATQTEAFAPTSVSATPLRLGSDGQTGHTACKKVAGSAKPSTDMPPPPPPSHVKNFKVANTPTHHRYTPTQHRDGSLTSRDHRPGPPSSAGSHHQQQHHHHTHNQYQQSRLHAGAPDLGGGGSSQVANTGFVTARGPRALPFSNPPASTSSSPMRQAPLTARPSRGNPVPVLALQTGASSAAAAASAAATAAMQPPSAQPSGPGSRPSSNSRLARVPSLGRAAAPASSVAEESAAAAAAPSPRRAPSGTVPLTPRNNQTQPANPTSYRPPWRSGSGGGAAPMISPRPGTAAAGTTGVTRPSEISPRGGAAAGAAKAAGAGAVKAAAGTAAGSGAAGVVPRLSMDLVKNRAPSGLSSRADSGRSSSGRSSGSNASGSSEAAAVPPPPPRAPAVGAAGGGMTTARAGPLVPALRLGAVAR